MNPDERGLAWRIIDALLALPLALLYALLAALGWDFDGDEPGGQP